MKFQDDILNMNTHIHTYIRTSRNQYVPHFFKVGGITRIGFSFHLGMSGITDTHNMCVYKELRTSETSPNVVLHKISNSMNSMFH